MFWLLFGTIAFAQAPGAAQPSALEMFLPFIFIFVIFYFLIIRPQARRQKDHQKFVNELKRGDTVVTTSGIFGKIEGLNEGFVTLEVADGVRIKMLRSQILSSQEQATKATTEGKK